jgi:RimJ/RimL family protein N-acetyltransferase
MLALPILESNRLRLRPIEIEDTSSVFSYASHPDVGPNAGWKPHDTIDESLAFIQYCLKKRDYNQPGTYAIIHKEDNRMIGTIEIHSYKEHKAEIGLVLHPDYWGKGLMTEAGKLLVIYAFEVLELERLAYCHFVDNIKSKHVAQRLGFTFEGVLRKKFRTHTGKALDEAVYSITDDDYKEDLPWLKEFKEDHNIL